MSKKLFSQFSCKFNSPSDLVKSVNNQELLKLLSSHGVDLEQEINQICIPLNEMGTYFPSLMPSPIIPNDEAVEMAINKYNRQGVMAYYPESVFADENGIGFIVRYRINKDLDFYAMVVRNYDGQSYSRLFANQHNMPDVAVKEYANDLDLADLTKLPFYKEHSLTYNALCRSTKYTGDVYIHEIPQNLMESPVAKREILEKLTKTEKMHGYNVVALYSNGGSIIHCEDKMGNPFDSFVLNVEYYNLSYEKIHEEHYVFAYGQEYIPLKDEKGEIYKDEDGRVYYDINHTPDATGKLKPFENGEAEGIFYQYYAPKYGTRYPLLGESSINI